jgi:hypothetical protein
VCQKNRAGEKCCEVGKIGQFRRRIDLQDGHVWSNVAREQECLDRIAYTRATRDPKDVVSYSGAEGTRTPDLLNAIPIGPFRAPPENPRLY